MEIEFNQTSKSRKPPKAKRSQKKEQEQMEIAHAAEQSNPGEYAQYLRNLDNFEDPTVQLITLQELSQVLSLATEDMFVRHRQGYFNTNQFCQSLVKIIKGPENTDFNPAAMMGIVPDLILLSCRCLFNLIESNPSCIATIVHHNGPQALISKLLEIEYIDLAEQLLNVLERISADYPGSILKANGLSAILMYIDFFSIHIQRVAVKVVANTCQSLPRLDPISNPPQAIQAYAMISDIMETLMRLLSYPDPKLVQDTVLTLHRITNWTTRDPERMESLFSNHLAALVQYLQNIVQEQGETFPTVSVQMFKLFSALAKHSKQFATSLVCEHHLLEILQSYMCKSNPSKQEEAIVQFTVSRSPEHLVQVLGLLCDLLPSIPPEDDWLVSQKPDLTNSIRSYTPDGLVLQKYNDLCVPLLLQVFGATVHVPSRTKVTECISKCLHFSKPTSPQHFSKLILELVSMHELALGQHETNRIKSQALILVLYGLLLANIASQKYPSNVQEFVREGLAAEIKQLKLKIEALKEISESESEQIDTQSETSSPDRLKRYHGPMLAGFTSEVFTREQCLLRIKGLLNTLNDRFEQLQALASPLVLVSEQIRATEQLDSLRDFLLTDHAVTCHEFETSGLTELLIAYLTKEQNSTEDSLCLKVDVTWQKPLEERVQLFCELFFSQKEPVLALIKIVMEYISRYERVRLTTIGSSFDAFDGGYFLSGLTNSPLAQFTRQIKINVTEKEAPTQVLVITIQAVATFAALQDYLRSKTVFQSHGDIQVLADDEDDEMMTSSQSNGETYQFYCNGKPVSLSATIFGALLRYNPDGSSNLQDLWSKTHHISFSKTPAPVETMKQESKPLESWKQIYDGLQRPVGFPRVGNALVLLKLVYHFSKHAHLLVQEPIQLDPFVFVNGKLTAKFTRQLDEALIVVSQVLPPWSKELMSSYYFLIPFKVRVQYLKGSAFGHMRSLLQWQEKVGTKSIVGRIERSKSTVKRQDLMQALTKTMSQPLNNSILEIQFADEVGTGLGPTLEFFSLVSQELQQELLIDNQKICVFQNTPDGLYPIPMQPSKQLAELFVLIGKFTAKALLDSRPLDLVFSKVFLEQVVGSRPLFDQSIIKQVDPVLARRMQDLTEVDDLGLVFVLPGTQLELVPDGDSRLVKSSNLKEYLELVPVVFCANVKTQVEAFRQGFDSVISTEHIKCFDGLDLSLLISGDKEEDWSISTLRQTCKADHGYQASSRIVDLLFEVMSEFDLSDRRLFLQFITGAPRLPMGGFKSLNPSLTIVRKTVDAIPDTVLPSVMTCANYLKLPEYSSKEVLREKIVYAMNEGRGSFHLS
ncbi:hypothetical protein EDD86DRAFT_197106 [Gorgonomyces haynaldii]|nr:hypothetical protein EDD86DRAFT_197106 [Gorgonomyces haynaldii]